MAKYLVSLLLVSMIPATSWAVRTADCPETFYVSVTELEPTEQTNQMMSGLTLAETFASDGWIHPNQMSKIAFASMASKGRYIGGLMKIYSRSSGVCKYLEAAFRAEDEDERGRNRNSNFYVRIDGNSQNPMVNVTYLKYLDWGFSRVELKYKFPLKTLQPRLIEAKDGITSVDVKAEATDSEWGVSKVGSAKKVTVRYQEPVEDDDSDVVDVD